MRKQRGLTLVEVMTVVFILGILLGVAVPNFVKVREQTHVKACLSNLQKIHAAKEQYAMDDNLSNGDVVTLDALVSSGYLRTLPRCSSGGDYALLVRPIGQAPGCPVMGHVLP